MVSSMKERNIMSMIGAVIHDNFITSHGIERLNDDRRGARVEINYNL